MLCGIFMQTIAGYYHYELLQYFEELYIVTFPQSLFLPCLRFSFKLSSRNKFIGHGIVIGIFVLVPILFNFGWENTLYLFGNTPPYTYSDMNGYGHFVPALFWSITYWLAISAFLGVISIALTRRGADDAWPARRRLAAARLPRLIPALVISPSSRLGSGVWYYYNAHVLNEYLNAKQRRAIQADYERSFKKYENLPQPKITAVDTRVDIDPEHRSFSGWGTYTLKNKTSESISQIHITDQMQSVSNVNSTGRFIGSAPAPATIYSIYALDEPLAPGDNLQMTFNVGYRSHGFRDGNERAELAYNGTFFDSGYFPAIGYIQDLELDDPRRRREEHLGPLEEMAPRGDPTQSLYNVFMKQSDWITYHTIVSTSPDQIAIAPGYLRRAWQQDGRNFFEYDMGTTNILDFFAYHLGALQRQARTIQGNEA